MVWDHSSKFRYITNISRLQRIVAQLNITRLYAYVVGNGIRLGVGPTDDAGGDGKENRPQSGHGGGGGRSLDGPNAATGSNSPGMA